MRRCGADAEMRKYEDVDTRMRTIVCGESDAKMQDSEIWMQRYGCGDVDAEMRMWRC